MNIQDAIACLEANGYRVTARKTAKPVKPLGLNAIGKPYSALYDPRYRMKYRTPRYPQRAQSVDGISPAKWAEMCKLAAAAWKQRYGMTVEEFNQSRGI